MPLPVCPTLLTEHASTHAHVGRGKIVQDAAGVDTEMRIRSPCPHCTFRSMPDPLADARRLEMAVAGNNITPLVHGCRKLSQNC